MTDFWRLTVLCLAFSMTLRALRAHPAHAEEINRPFVAGFERFYSPLDDDAYLTDGGHLLLNELNCVACHEPPKTLHDRFGGVEGPRLQGVGTRIGDAASLQLLIRNPRVLKRATTMPSLFAGPGRDLAELDALFHFMVSLEDEEERPPQFLGIAKRGQKLYHEAGCVACHVPDAEFRPGHLPEDFQLELPALPSHPIRLAAIWKEDYLTRYLQDPPAHHPGGRMPNFWLGRAGGGGFGGLLAGDSGPGGGRGAAHGSQSRFGGERAAALRIEALLELS